MEITKFQSNYENCIFEFKNKIVHQFVDPNEYKYFILPGTTIYNYLSKPIRYLFRGFTSSNLYFSGTCIYNKIAERVAVLPHNYWSRDISVHEYNYIVQERIKLYM